MVSGPGYTGPTVSGGGCSIAVTDIVAPPLSTHALIVGATLAPSATPAAIATSAMTIRASRSPIMAPR